MDINLHERLSIITLRLKFSACIAVLQSTVIAGSSTMRKKSYPKMSMKRSLFCN